MTPTFLARWTVTLFTQVVRVTGGEQEQIQGDKQWHSLALLLQLPEYFNLAILSQNLGEKV